MSERPSVLAQALADRTGCTVPTGQKVPYFSDGATEYEAATQGAAIADLGPRSRIELRGADRESFFNNYCTNDIRYFGVGGRCEAFVTTVKGHTLGHVFVFALPDSLLVESVGGAAGTLIPHLDKYVIREDVQIVDVGRQIGELLLVGPDWAERLKDLCDGPVAKEAGRVVPVEIGSSRAWLAAAGELGLPAWQLFVPNEDLPDVCRRALDTGATPIGCATLDVLRIESGWPLYDVDFDERNLPQEVGRDAEAISFTKGCYLGQETVARVDALGHVNQRLCCVQFEEWHSVSVLPTELHADGQWRGRVTSIADSPAAGALLGIGIVRVEHAKVGSRLESIAGPVRVVTPPRAAEPRNG